MSVNGKPKSVLFIVENLPVPRDRRVWQEAKALHGAGWKVSVICPQGPGCTARREVIDGIHVYRHWLPAEGTGPIGYAKEYAVALFWESVLSWVVLLTHGFDVIHACNPPETIFLVGLFFKVLLGKRFIFDHHDLSPELYETKFGKRGFFHDLLLHLERWTYRTADIAIATNESFRQVAIRRGGMDPDRVFVVRSGPDLTRMKIVPAQPALKRGRDFLVGYLGVMNSQDGIDLLIRAVEHLVRRRGRTDVNFVLIGEGPDRCIVEALVDRLELRDWVHFTGWLDHEGQLPWLCTADVCVAPDPSNGFNDKCTMNKIVEYMAVGRPVVLFDLPEGRVSAGEAGVYAPNNDVAALGNLILSLLDDPARRRRMGEVGRARIEGELSWQRQAPRLIAAYEALEVPELRRQVRQRTST